MNERIKAFADESAKYSATMALPTGKNSDELFLEKFTELVRDDEREACEKLCDEAIKEIRDEIKEHFGVEELT